jgi:hypothetical protein
MGTVVPIYPMIVPACRHMAHGSALVDAFRYGIVDELVQATTRDMGFENLDIHFIGHFHEVW